jgi:hypothetical protein
MSNSLARVLGSGALACVVFACDAQPARPAPAREAAPARETSPAKPAFVRGQLPVAPFVAELVASAPEDSMTLVYVGAAWCEPCQRFPRALEAGELDAQLPGVRLIEYDSDAARDALSAAGYGARLIPLFALPGSDGRASGRQIEGSIKGDGAVANIMPRLLELTTNTRQVRR